VQPSLISVRKSVISGRVIATILAVDDSISIRQMVTFILKNEGYEVIDAVDGQEA
jgi:CheY-like chemotaxis protein